MKQLFLVYALVLAAFVFAPVSAAAKISDDCVRTTGDVLCEDPVGESEVSDGKSEAVVTTSKGNETNKAQCSGPGNSQSGC